MANISKELNQIKNAVYGKEVRQAIHDGIEKAYNDATSGGAGDTNLEVVLARGNYDALNKRLDAADSQLADKADKTYIDDRLGNLNGLQFKGAYNTVQQLQSAYPNGTEGLFVIHQDNHWYYWDGSEWSKGNELTTIPWTEYMYSQNERWSV